MKPILTIFSYSGQEQMLDRHMPWFEKAECDIIISSPVDAPCRRRGKHENVFFSDSEHHGPELMTRVMRTFQHVLSLERENYWFMEGDGIALRPPPAQLADGVHGYIFDNHRNPNFKGREYIHWAWGINRETMVKICEAFPRYDPGEEAGSPDRFLGYLCQEEGIEMHHRPDVTFSRNAITDGGDFAGAQMLINRRGCFIHGIKEEWQLKRLRMPR